MGRIDPEDMELRERIDQPNNRYNPSPYGVARVDHLRRYELGLPPYDNPEIKAQSAHMFREGDAVLPIEVHRQLSTRSREVNPPR
jgi:hypothetical protein